MPSERPTTSRNEILPDEFPARPRGMRNNELKRANSMMERKETLALVLLCSVYFLYGSGLGMTGPLYPEQARAVGIKTYEYGTAISAHYLAALLFYPVACHMVFAIDCRLALSTSAMVGGVCNVLIGALSRTTDTFSFILLSCGIQILEGFGFSILLAATTIFTFTQVPDRPLRKRTVMLSLFILGISVSPFLGEGLNEISDFAIPFYLGGTVLCVVSAIVILTFPRTEGRISCEQIPFLAWVKQPRMIYYFIVVYSTFNYIGYLLVTLEPHLQLLHLNNLKVGALYVIPAASFAFSSLGWSCACKIGVNSVLLICISSLLLVASLCLIGPSTFTTLNLNPAIMIGALFLSGFGFGGKLSCVFYTAYRDISLSQNGVAQYPLLVFTVFGCGALLGCFSGSFVAGYAYYYFGMGEGVYFFIGLEVITIAVSFVFAFKRNYVAPKSESAVQEQNPILRS